MIQKNMFGETLKLLSKQRGFTNYQLSILADTDESQISKYLKGTDFPTAATAVNMVNIFGVGLTECIHGLSQQDSKREAIINQILSMINIVENSKDLAYIHELIVKVKMSKE